MLFIYKIKYRLLEKACLKHYCIRIAVLSCGINNFLLAGCPVIHTVWKILLTCRRIFIIFSLQLMLYFNIIEINVKLTSVISVPRLRQYNGRILMQ